MVSAPALLSILILSWAVGPVPTGRPDSWMPFQDQRIVSESGRHYAVIRGRHGKTPANFEFVRRRIGYPALAPAQSHGWLYEDSEDARLRERAKAERAKVARDPKDALLGTGTLSQEPLAQKLIEQPLGLLLFEQYAGVGRGQVLTWCTPGGKVAWTRDLRALFGGRPRGGYSTVSSTWWYSSWGFDSASGKAWVLSLGHEMRLVDVATGKVEVPDERLVAEIASRASASDCEALLDAAIEADQVDYRPFVSVFEKIAKDESRPLAIRLRAALVVRRGGGKPESFVGLFRSSVREASLDNARFAGVHLDELTCDVKSSIVALSSLLCREPPFHRGLTEMGLDRRMVEYGRVFRSSRERGVAMLKRLANNPDVPTDANLNACMLLWHGGHEVFPRRLEHLLRQRGESVANSALNALIDSEPRGMHEYLVGLCATGMADPVRLAMYFESNPDRAAVPWLRRTLACWPEGAEEYEIRALREALDACVTAIAAVPTVRPDRWGPFLDQRIVSQDGRHYVVIRGDHGKTPLRFEFVRRREGVPPIRPAECRGWLEEHADNPAEVARARAEAAKVARDPEDRLLGSGTMPQRPLSQLLVEEPLGLLLFEKHANLGGGQVLTWCSPDGKVAWTHDLKALFGGIPKGGYSTSSSQWWFSAWGFDANSGNAWVLTRGHEMRLVDLASGRIEVPTEALVAGIAVRGSDSECEALLSAAVDANNVDYRPFVSLMSKLAYDASRPLAIRLRAALLAHRGGGSQPQMVGWFREVTRTAPLEDARFAGIHLAEVTGGAAASIAELHSLLCREEPFSKVLGYWGLDTRLRDYGRALHYAGAHGVAMLKALANNPHVPAGANLNACRLLWHGGHEGFPSRLDFLLRGCGKPVGNSALNTLIDSKPRGMHAYLVNLCSVGVADPVRLARYFEKHPDRAVVSWLRGLESSFRADDDGFEATSVRDALAACERVR